MVPTRLLMAVALLAAAGSGAADDTAGRAATFDVRHELKVTVPEGSKSLRLWMAIPQADPAQSIEGFKVESPYPTRETRDDHGNAALFLEANDPKAGEFSVVTTFRIRRSEVRAIVDATKARPITEKDRAELAAFLKPSTHVILDERIRDLAAKIVGTETNPVLATRKIYDWVLENIDYWVKDPANKKASPVGSTDYCLTSKTGNCTDFHSLTMSLTMQAGIPTRITYGSFFKKELDGKDADQSYHCWLDVFAPGIGWIPLDVAVADVFVGDFELNDTNGPKVRLTTADGYTGPDRAKVDYYFGNLEERRVTWSTGRDLILEPKQAGGPVNALAKAYVEIDGKVHAEGTGWKRMLTFKETH